MLFFIWTSLVFFTRQLLNWMGFRSEEQTSNYPQKLELSNIPPNVNIVFELLRLVWYANIRDLLTSHFCKVTYSCSGFLSISSPSQSHMSISYQTHILIIISRTKWLIMARLLRSISEISKVLSNKRVSFKLISPLHTTINIVQACLKEDIKVQLGNVKRNVFFC